MLDDELEQDESFARVGVSRAWIEMDAQLPVRLNKCKICETCGMGESHSWCYLAPPFIHSQILVRTIFVRENRVGSVARQSLRQIIGAWCVERDFTGVDEVQSGVGKKRLGERRIVHTGVGLRR